MTRRWTARWSGPASALVVLVVASLRLGRALTPTPMPAERGELQTGGLYRFVRHPGYAGMLVAMPSVGIALGSWVSAARISAAKDFIDTRPAGIISQIPHQIQRAFTEP